MRISSGWIYVFYLLAGMSLISAVIGSLVIPRDTRTLRGEGIDRRVDWIGGVLATGGLCLFTFSLTDSGTARNGWRTPRRLLYDLFH
jgi:hypothetical protein